MLAAIAIVAVVLAALLGWMLSERGLPFIVARIVAQSGGRISVEQPSGSIAGTMRFRRITWHGIDATVIADDVVVDWNPGALWSSRLSIRGLGARHVDIAIKPSAAATAPPTDLALPVAVSIDRLAVARIDWRAGPHEGQVSGLEFGYDGDGTRHRIHDLRFVADQGTIAGTVSVAARAPLAVNGQLAMTGAGALEGARLAVTLSGTLPELNVAAAGTLRGARLTADATATPFAQAAFARARADLGGVDAAAFDPALPHTKAHLRLEARAQAAGIAGTLDLGNDDAGPIDGGRLPVAALTASYAFDGTTLALDDVAAMLAGGGSARGSVRIVIGADARAARAKLALRDVDLARIDTRLAATRLAGNIDASADAAQQTLQGELADRRMSLAFAAVVTPARIDVTRFLARTGSGSLRGSANLVRNDAGDFSLHAAMHRVDPSRFFAMPPSALDGSVDARGAMRPAWRVSAGATIAPGSRFDGVAVSGTGRATLEAATIRNADIDLAIASARLHAKGDAGRSGDSVSVTFDAPRLGELVPLLPAALPRPVAGEVHVKAALDTGASAGRNGDPGTGAASAAAIGSAIAANAGGELALRASGLKAGEHYAAATLALRASLSRSTSPRPAAWRERRLRLDLDATGIATPLRSLDWFHASVSGTPAQHRMAIALRGTDIDASAHIDAALTGIARPAQAAWSGTLVSLENRGAVAFALGGPATFALARHHLRLSGVHVVAAGGRADIDELAWDSGHIATRGRFSGVTLAKAAALAGRRLPFDSTLVVGGDWSIAAAPRLEGNFALHRERGDIYAAGAPAPDANGTGANAPTATAAAPATASERRGLGITTLDVTGTLHDDALDARAAFVATLAGTASATLHVGVAPGAPVGTIGADAPLALALRGEFASLAALQPWVGTSAAVDGKATIDVAARGTLAEPLWSGSVAGDALRIDAPQYGIDLSKGRLRAHLASTGIVLDELELAGGDGRFTATGNLALPGAADRAGTRVTWQARRFRVANRPDLRLVLDGDGSLRLANRKLALAGSIRIVEGHVEYEATPTGRLAPDIVVKGEPRPGARGAGLRDFPLSLDVDVDLGPAMTFSGEGLVARLAGSVKVSTAANGTLQGRGTIRTINGSYYAFGQRLTIDRGQVIFDGALDNPALDVVALRKNLAVEAGVQLTGTVKLPQVRVTSNPPVAENEALAWLVTGQGLNASGRADYAALSAASALLLGRGGKPLSAQIAQRVGLDEISLQSIGAAGTTGTASQVVVLGKRLSDRLTLGYEQGLSLATSALRLEYALSSKVTVRAEAGAVSGLSLVYRRAFK